MTHQPADYTIASTASLLEALAALNRRSGGVMTLLVADSEGRLAGTLTDGDIRRALLGGAGLDSPVAAAMHTPCAAIDADAPDKPALMREIRARGIRLVPVVDGEGRVTRLVDTAATRTLLPVSALLMAGGRGQRLQPLTLSTPKPLLPVGDKAIIDYNIEALAACGVTDITVTVNYLAEQLEEHFAQPVAGVKVHTVREPRALGTIGSAALACLPEEGTTLVMNSDLLTEIDFEEMWLRHSRAGADITVAAIPYNVSVPYAVLAIEGSGTEARITSLEEKPTYSHYANAGIYLFSNRLLRSLPIDRPTDAPDLIADAIARGLKVIHHPFDDMWIDIGNPADYRHACEIMRSRQHSGPQSV